MKKIVRLTEQDLVRLVKRVLKEDSLDDWLDEAKQFLMDAGVDDVDDMDDNDIVSEIEYFTTSDNGMIKHQAKKLLSQINSMFGNFPDEEDY